ncbi:penicillin-binding protein 1A [Thiolapillus brandeum]|uniref:Penicillin-binding protein 1A n=1 Tax=Thiolapillus brandeum TaxID=1076588 RepID=A0A7U6GGF2_9GAMM|nr:penicillin-binding protein 1A [Thiolapillus brandeum]BAO43109.1 penicillin-binding protein 1A [Thiolapillus brandeum]
MIWFAKALKYGALLVLLGIVAAALIVGGTYLHFRSELPSTENLLKIQLQVPMRIFSADGKLIAQYGEKRRDPVSYEEIPEDMVNAFLAAEDQNFFQHYGIDPAGLIRAAVTLALTGHKKQGGSTITMQVARNYYLTRKRTFTRKIREIFLALHIEQELNKKQILELYLNKIYLGHRAYGIKAAAQVYYGRPLDQLTLAETAMIAGLPKAPSNYNPVTNPERALLRRNYVLGRMLALGYISREQAEQARAAPVTASLHHAEVELEAPWVAEMVREKLVRDFGPETYTSGLNVYTTISSKLQNAANQGLRTALEDYDRRHGWRGAEKHYDTLPEDEKALDDLISGIPTVHKLLPAIVTSVEEKSATVYLGKGRRLQIEWQGLRWARPYVDESHRGNKPGTAADILQIGDLVRVRERSNDKGESWWELSQIPAVAGALVSLNPANGALNALVGGYDFRTSKFNRATQAKRQPGSGFKPIIYSAALEAGFTAASVINDAPVVMESNGDDETWRPENYSGKFYGPTRLRWALTKSRNLVSIRLLRAMGIKHALEHAKRFGFDPDQLPHALSLALGSGEVTPWQMARAYAVLANGGYLIDPYFIDHIEKNGQTIYEADPLVVGCGSVTGEAEPSEAEADSASESCRSAPRTLPEDNRYIMYSMMQDVIRRGTGVRARSLGHSDLAGKTGTTNEQRDAWFTGYNQHIVTTVWTGFDDNSRLGKGEVGGRVALPAWIAFMKVALEDIPNDPPEMPSDLVTIRIDNDTGLQVSGDNGNTSFEVFRPGHEPPMQETDSGKLPEEDATDGKPTTVRPDDLF